MPATISLGMQPLDGLQCLVSPHSGALPARLRSEAGPERAAKHGDSPGGQTARPE